MEPLFWNTGQSKGDACELAVTHGPRDGGAVQAALGALTAGAEGDANLMPAVIAAVRAEATLGEISAALRDVFGAYRPASAAQI